MANDLPTYNEADNQLIEDYLDGLLSEQSRKEVEERLQTDPDFAAQLALHQDIEGVLNTSEKQELKQNWAELILEVEEEMQVEKPENPLKVVSKMEGKKGKRSFSWLQIAAIILVLLIPAILYFMGVFDRTSSTYPQQLAMEYFEAPENMTIAKRGGTDTEGNIEELKQQVQSFYEQKDYRNALEVLQKMAKNGSAVNMSQVYFSMGICHFLLKENEAAIQSFLKVRSRDGIKSKADWYLALTYLQQGDTIKAKEILKQVAEKDVNVKRKKKAQDLLEKLVELKTI